MKDKFSSKEKTALQFYVYRLIDPRNGETFYVGKGKGNRVFDHVKGSVFSESEGGQTNADNLETDEFLPDEVSEKIARIREIRKTGLEVIHIIHRHGMSDDVAREVEAALIDAFPGLSNIQGGTGSNDYGPMHVTQIEAKYAADEATFEHNCLIIKLSSDSTRSVKQRVGYAWRVDGKRVKGRYILAVEQGVIKGVFTTEKGWTKVSNGSEIDGRWEFTPEDVAKEIRDIYIDKRLPAKYMKRGASNPIWYVDIPENSGNV